MTFLEVYREHFRFVWRSLRRLGVPESDAADAAQDVFLVVHRRLAEFEGRARMTTWLFGICANVAAARRRLAHVRREVSSEDVVLPEEPSDERTDTAALAERHQGLTLLDQALEQMPVEQRAVFVMFEVEEISCDEIAAIVDIPPGTVRSRLRLARESFRATLGRMQERDRFRLRAGEA
jgi:RNA polymerase sigma-70 factor (ECF subfamily)